MIISDENDRSISSSKKTILLVEDNPDDEALALHALGRIDCDINVVVARDGVEAMDYLFRTGNRDGREPSGSPSLIIMDLKMPKVNGFELLKRLRGEPCTKLIPVIVLSSSGVEQDIINSYSYGANSYIRKKVDFTQMTDILRLVCQYWFSINVTVHCS